MKGIESQTINFEVNPYVFSLLRAFGQTDNKSPSQAAHRILLAWLQEVVDASNAAERQALLESAPPAQQALSFVSKKEDN